ncbi:MAG: putative tRNA/rRNA methyltransferase [Alphaproteobacteria bacterium MarineAlpha8_Bin1]|nr:MAG: putative tRNA/rRNA methyltransferase [Alphaproteobacteria bacterium MarineAlpha8_Bin1]|tara:strand:- start:2476 stop:3189 length:714 start_codon:yes stop_codon:yes gene_type:complete
MVFDLKSSLEIILINTQLPENLGATARGMLNFNIENLRLVGPHFEMNNEKILPLSAGADHVIKKIKVYENFEKSIEDLDYIIATTNRERTLKKKKVNFNEILKLLNSKRKIGIVFGPEKSGLDNDHISLSDYILKIPSNKKFSSINLSHAVTIVCYEISKIIFRNIKSNDKIYDLAPKKELMNFYKILENKLEEKNFFMVDERKKITIQKIRNIFSKSLLNINEIKILLGILKSLEK